MFLHSAFFQINTMYLYCYSNYLCHSVFHVAKHSTLFASNRKNPGNSIVKMLIKKLLCIFSGELMNLRNNLKTREIIQAAEDALKYYLGFEGKCDREYNALYKEFERLKSIACERKAEERLCAADFCKFIIIHNRQLKKF